MCKVIAKIMSEEPFNSIITKVPGMSLIFSFFGAKISAKIFCDEIKKGAAENAD